MPDLVVSLGLVGVLVLVVCAYGARVLLSGPAHFARVEAAGSSVLLSRRAMDMAYWALAPLGRSLSRAGVRPNSISLASLGLGVVAGVALASGHFGVGAALSAASALGDALDGFVARETGNASDAGETLDAAVDRYSEFSFLGGLAIFYHENVPLLALVLCALLGSFMVSYATAKAEALGVTPPRGAMRRAERATYLTVAAALVPFASEAVRTFSWTLNPNLPMILALGIVAVVANVSSAERLMQTAELARRKQAGLGQPLEARGSPSENDSSEITLRSDRPLHDAADLHSVVR